MGACNPDSNSGGPTHEVIETGPLVASGSKKYGLTRIFFSEIEQSIHLLEAHEKGDVIKPAVTMALKRGAFQSQCRSETISETT